MSPAGSYAPPVDDIRFLLEDVFAFDVAMAELPGRGEVDAALALDVLGEAGRFCATVLEPLNRSGDREGCRLENGVVVTPEGFPDAYAAFVAAGWGGLSGDPAFRGQGLPRTIQILLDEMMSAANLSFGLFPGLTRGAAETVARHADADLKAAYLPELTTGEWTGAMALTEAAAGSDLGLLTTRARPRGDGSHAVTGTKIFISSGDQDFGRNVIHLVLARLPDAPPGVKGISLFLVPKFLPGAGRSLGTRNNLSVGSIEHKMGLHAQPTCTINYDGAAGWLVGEPGRGLNAMFTMMNAERLFVGIQGLGIAAAAYGRAAAYARERRQGRAGDGSSAGPAAIVAHPDVRRMLMTIRAFVEGGRALAVWTALAMDRAAAHPDRGVRDEAEGFVALLTPVIKAAFTDLGFEAAVTAQQVFGGHGYVRDWGMEQFVRDARITQIYEGTNGMQALDLAARKLSVDDGALPRRFFALVEAELAAARAGAAADLAGPVAEALARLRRATEVVRGRSRDAAEVGAAATDYLRLFALVALGWMWVRMAARAVAPTGGASRGTAAKAALARFYVDRLLPQTVGLEITVAAGSGSMMALAAEDF